MRRPALGVLLPVVALLALQGCAKPMPGAEHLTRVEVYFRDFDTPSPEAHTPETLPRVATIKADITDAPTMARVMAAVTIQCAAGASKEADPMDLFLLVRAYEGKRMIGVRRASRFNIDQLPESRRCPLTDADRARISQVMASLK
jgi:hypothetical protein